MTVRNSDPNTELASRLRARILALARAAGQRGITIGEAEQQIPEHKNASVSPRFAELVARGELIRLLVGYGKPTKRFPGGVPRYLARLDTETKRCVIIHFAPGFEPLAPKEDGAKAA